MKTLGWLSLMGLTACAPSLAGQLHGSSGEALVSREARVNITPLSAPSAGGETSTVVVVPVDAKGHFATTDKLPQGDYLVEALVPGYAPQSKKISLASSQTVDLTLTPLAATKIRSTSTNSHVDEDRGAGRATLTPPSL